MKETRVNERTGLSEAVGEVAWREIAKGQTLAGAEGCGNAVIVLLVGAEMLLASVWATAFDTIDVLVNVGNIPRAASLSIERVGCSTETGVGGAVPVSRIVTGAVSRTSKVGYFVVLIAGGCYAVDEVFVHRALCLLIGE